MPAGIASSVTVALGQLGDVGPVLLEARLGRSGDGQRHRSAQRAGEQLPEAGAARCTERR